MFNPADIVDNLKLMMQGMEPRTMVPWYKGYQGTIEPSTEKEKSYRCTG